MNIRKKLLSCILLCSFISVGIFFTQALANDGPATELVIVTGSAETRDGALVDACRLAIAKVHGGRVAGILLKTNERVGKFNETRDATALSFDGLLTNYTIKKESQPGIVRKLWQIEIEASVLRSFPDKFAGRIMVRVPSAEELVDSGMDGKIAQEVAKRIAHLFANSQQFALLERDQEIPIDDELARAASDTTSARDKSRIGGQKTADIIILIDGGSINLNESLTNFKNTSRQSHTCVAGFSMVIKIIDVMTKGELGREEISISEKKSTSDPQRSRNEAMAAMIDQLPTMFSRVGLRLFAHLDCTRLSVKKDGTITWISPERDIPIQDISAVRLHQIVNETSVTPKVHGTYKVIDAGRKLSIDPPSDDFPFEEILKFYPELTQ